MSPTPAREEQPRLRLVDIMRDARVPTDEKLERLAVDFDGLRVLTLATAQTQRATGDAVAAVADSTERIERKVDEHGTRLERIEDGVLEAIGLAKRAESRAHDALASDVDLAETIERERVAREVEARRIQELLAPVVADVSRRAGNAGAAKTAGAFSLAAIATGLFAQPVETLKLLREIGPTGLAIAVALLLVGLVVRRRKP